MNEDGEIVDIREIHADRLKYATYPENIPDRWIEEHPAQLGKIGALSNLATKDVYALILAIEEESLIKLATKYTIEEIDFCAEDILMEMQRKSDLAYTNLMRSVGGKTLVLGLSKAARYEYTPLPSHDGEKNGRFYDFRRRFW